MATLHSRVYTRKTALEVSGVKRYQAEHYLDIACPEVASQWHQHKNGAWTPNQFTFRSGQKVWWQCPVSRDHAWLARIASRTKGSGCPYCAGKLVTVADSLASTQPTMAKEWHPSLNGKLTPRDVYQGSGRRIWWRCKRNLTHIWQTTPRDRTRDRTGCPYCSGRRICAANSLAALFPELVKEWHPTKNGALTANDVRPGSSQKIWWRCKRSKHIWQAQPKYRTGNNVGCPYCSGRRVCPTNSLAALFPKLAKQWHQTKNGTLTPHNIRPGSNTKVWWQCMEQSTHIWQAHPNSRIGLKSGCPHCARIPTKSLADLYPTIAKQWHQTKNGRLTPNDVSFRSARKVWWRCAKNPKHVWASLIYSRTSGSGCPLCAGRRKKTG